MQKTATTTPKGQQCATRIAELFEGWQINNADLVQIIEVCGQYLNIQTRANYAKQNGLSYNGTKHHRQNISLFGNTYIIDND